MPQLANPIEVKLITSHDGELLMRDSRPGNLARVYRLNASGKHYEAAPASLFEANGNNASKTAFRFIRADHDDFLIG